MNGISYRWALAGVTASTLAVLATAPANATDAAPGAPGLGDRIFPTLGNGGYDVQHYDVALTWSAASRSYRADTVVTAVATQALSRFDLDFAGNTVRRVTVDGRAAQYTRNGEELVVTPPVDILRGRHFRVQIDYTGDPTPYQGADPDGTKGFFPTADGFFVAPQPQAAHSVFPCNDHPSDKATITYRLTVPPGLTGAANGELADVEPGPDGTTWTWRHRAPIAPEVATIAVGKYAVYHHAGPAGLPLRDVVPAADLTTLQPFLDRTSAQIAWLESHLGRYPFGTYGLLLAPGTQQEIGFSEETQTLTVFPEWIATADFPVELTGPAEVHELTHQWFGDSVTPRTWSDVWLNEGPATYFAAAYAAEHGGPPLAEQARRWYAGSDSGSPFDHPESDQQLRDQYGPPGTPKAATTLYSQSIYTGGALALYALRQHVGQPTFDAIMRTWLSTYHDGNADTTQFIHIANRVAGQDLRTLLDTWLYAPTSPPLPAP